MSYRNRYDGNARDALSYHNGMKFSTYDRDNDAVSNPLGEPYNCAAEFGGNGRGGFWFRDCFGSGLNAASRDHFVWRGLPGGEHLSASRVWLLCM